MHHVSREQRLARRLLIAVTVLVVLVATPLILSESLRLRIAYTLDLVPGGDMPRLFSAEDDVELVVLREEVPQSGSRPQTIFTAVYIAERTGEGIVLHDLTEPREIAVPLADYDYIAVGADQNAVLVVHESAPVPRAALVTIATGEVEPLLDGQTVPDLPGDWGQPHYAGGGIGCDGISPSRTWVACIGHSDGRAVYLAGNWELRVHPYGRTVDTRTVFRGRGLDPIVGWAPDESTLYFQNEHGLWRSNIEATES